MLLVGLVVLGSGCIFSPTKDKRPPDTTTSYLEPTSPENVLQNLITAYQARDSVAYKALYDPSYIGTSQDLADPNDTTSTFRYADEVAHMDKLGQVTTIVNVVFNIGLQTTWQKIPSDDPTHPEWIMIQINHTQIEIYDGATLYSAVNDSPVTFTFTPTTANGSTTWKIIRWNEVASST
jgi:hypothetical protein